MAKAAGEILAKYINVFWPNVHVISRAAAENHDGSDGNRGRPPELTDVLDVMLPIVY